jgi:hypothetical protein
MQPGVNADDDSYIRRSVTMTQSRFFQISLFLPVALWSAGLLFFLFVLKQGNELIVNNISNGYRVLVPYLIFAGILWKLSNNKPYRLLMFMAFVVPIAWGGFFTLFYIVVTLIKEGTLDKWYILLIMAFWAAVVAYVFEIIPLIIMSIFKNDFRPACADPAVKVPGTRHVQEKVPAEGQ